jgi:hypothetical protein
MPFQQSKSKRQAKASEFDSYTKDMRALQLLGGICSKELKTNDFNHELWAAI